MTNLMSPLYLIMASVVYLSVARTTILVRRRATDEFASVDGSAALAVLIVGVLGAALLISPQTRRVLANVRGTSISVMIAYCAIAVLSAIWSVLPSFSAFRAIEVLTILGAVLVLMSRHRSFRDAEQAMLRTLLVVTLLAFLYRAINIGLSLEALHTNTYSVTAAVGFVYAFMEWLTANSLRRKILFRWWLAFLLFLALGTSVGSNIGAAVGLLLALLFSGFARTFIIPVIVLGIGLVGLLGTGDDILTRTVFAGRDVDELSNLTGRTALWAGYFAGFLDRPLVGYGFAISARLGDFFGVRPTTNTHNGFIEAALGMGLIGFGLLVAYFAQFYREVLFTLRTQATGALGCFGAVTAVLVNNNSKSLLGGAYDPTFVGIFALLAFFQFHVLARAHVAQTASPVRSVRSSFRRTGPIGASVQP